MIALAGICVKNGEILLWPANGPVFTVNNTRNVFGFRYVKCVCHSVNHKAL